MRASGLLDGAVPPRGVLFDPEAGRGTELWSWLPAPGFGTAPVGRLLQQTAESDLRLLLGPHRLPVPQPAARQRVRADVNMHPVGPARQ